MDTTKLSFGQFLKLPAAKQLIAGCCMIIGALTSANIFQYHKNGTLNEDKITAEREKTAILKTCDSEKTFMAQKYEREYKVEVARQNQIYIDRLSKQYDESERRRIEGQEQFDRYIRNINHKVSGSSANIRETRKAINKIPNHEN